MAENILDYERHILVETVDDSALVVVARGLGLERIFLTQLKLYSVPDQLVLVLNTTTPDQEFFIESLQAAEIVPLPISISSDLAQSVRPSVYKNGGIQFVSSRILVVDLLSDQIPMDKLSGVLIYRAHKIINSAQESFILRLLRLKSEKVFIRAYSDQASAFGSGLVDTQLAIRALFVRSLYLWPRFHSYVVEELDKHKLDVAEVSVKLTSSMKHVQAALLDITTRCLREIKQENSVLQAAEHLNIENALGKWLDYAVRVYLDPIWHQLTEKTRSMVGELKILRKLLSYLELYHPETFWSYLDSLRESSKIGQQHRWIFLDVAQKLFDSAKNRLTTQESGSKCEVCPKWSALLAVLREILSLRVTMIEKSPQKKVNNRVLFLATDEAVCKQILGLFTEKPKCFKEFSDVFSRVKCHAENLKESNSQEDVYTLTQAFRPVTPDRFDSDAPLELHFVPLWNYYSILRALTALEPTFIVLYNADLWALRQAEIYKAVHPGSPVRLYFMMYQNSTEEQRYLTSLRKEKDSFEHLIRGKSNLAVSKDYGPLREPTPAIRGEISSWKAASGSVDSSEAAIIPQILVDLREFRSALPALIHKRGIDLVPLTLEVGDYILSPDICVERKSLSDLIGSLNSGRLYTQVQAMFRAYRSVILLVEFDGSREFFLHGPKQYGEVSYNKEIRTKLTILTMHYPKLRIIWTPSAEASAEIFEDLKWNKSEPDRELALQAKGDSLSRDLYDSDEFVSAQILNVIPGVSAAAANQLAECAKSILDLTHKNSDQLKSALGSESTARQVREFLNKKFDITTTVIEKEATEPPTKKTKS